MLTGQELADTVKEWRKATPKERRQVENDLGELRAKRLKWATATEGDEEDPELLKLLPGLMVAGPEESANLAAGLAKLARVEDALPAIELKVLQRLHSPKMAAWDTAARLLASGLEHPDIKAEPDLHRLFRVFWGVVLMGIAYPDADAIEAALLTPKAEQLAVSKAGRRNGLKPHLNHNKATETLPKAWRALKLMGMSKSLAAPILAKQLGLATTTVRKKLQGM